MNERTIWMYAAVLAALSIGHWWWRRQRARDIAEKMAALERPRRSGRTPNSLSFAASPGGEETFRPARHDAASRAELKLGAQYAAVTDIALTDDGRRALERADAPPQRVRAT